MKNTSDTFLMFSTVVFKAFSDKRLFYLQNLSKYTFPALEEQVVSHVNCLCTFHFYALNRTS